MSCPGHSYSTDFYKQSYGQWIVLKPFYILTRTWNALKEVVRSGFLGATGARCSTLRYNPLRRGAGPTTVGRIAIFTKEDDIMDVGMKLIKLSCVKQVIKYRIRSATLAMQYSYTTPGNQSIANDTLYWNQRKPSSERGPKCIQKKISFSYDSSKDRWKINVVDNFTFWDDIMQIHGKWIISSNFDKTSELNISKLWYTWKPQIEGGDIPAVKMECPGPKKVAKIHVFTSEKHMDEVGKSLIALVKSDITYYTGTRRNNHKTLYWNAGEPDYKKARK